MSLESESSGNRATVAMVYHEVASVKELMSARFDTLNVRLNDVSGLPAMVELHDRELAQVRRRVQELEDAPAHRRAAMGRLPKIAVAVAGFILVVLNIWQLVATGFS